jgi:hypothetical protein
MLWIMFKPNEPSGLKSVQPCVDPSASDSSPDPQRDGLAK